jgi:hypothetical protein
MTNHRSFGRRVGSPPRPRFAGNVEAVAQSRPVQVPVERPSPPPLASADCPSLDQELLEWKRARKRGFAIPWRQLSLMASLCFGIASFVLPDSVNDNVQWLLYALTAASLYAWYSRRRREAKG